QLSTSSARPAQAGWLNTMRRNRGLSCCAAGTDPLFTGAKDLARFRRRLAGGPRCDAPRTAGGERRPLPQWQAFGRPGGVLGNPTITRKNFGRGSLEVGSLRKKRIVPEERLRAGLIRPSQSRGQLGGEKWLLVGGAVHFR